MEQRIIIDNVRPRTTTGAFPAKAVVNEHVPVSADIFKDGHDVLSARVRWGLPGTERDTWDSAPLFEEMNDHWSGSFTAPSVNALHEFVVEAWLDTYKTWRHKAEVKLHARVDVTVELQEGVALFQARADAIPGGNAKARQQYLDVVGVLGNTSLDDNSRLVSAFTDQVAALMAEPAPGDVLSSSALQHITVDRAIAGFGTWYCAFPRSWDGLQGLTKQLDYIGDMGFDVLYITPIHPIGHKFRKGKNNTLDPTPDDVGVPYAIGNEDGGHTAINPDLGTIDDFDALVARAQEMGIELALDNALQCSPDHPWVTEHPEWFSHRPDGTIAYAENPPKKYQDIYPINFWPEKEADRVALWEACKETFTYWIEHGVKIFRVDNPHTKPFAFWEWCIGEIQKTNPEVIFLSEAFTRPKVMAKLAEVGFSQSYTYFTWRTWKNELIDYGVEVTAGPNADFMRPNFWPNTHDMLLDPLRNGPIGAFKSRFVLAATMVPNYGIYSGYEIQENVPLNDVSTDYFHSEKYEIRERNFDQPKSIAPYITLVNRLRRAHPALQELRNLWFHGTENDSVIAYSKRSADGSDTVLVVVNLDPQNAQESTLHLNLEKLGVADGMQFEAYDELSQRPFYWRGGQAYVWLPADEPAHILTIRTI